MAVAVLASAQSASAAGWAIQPVPPTRATGVLNSVSCGSRTRCVAVGNSGQSSVGYSARAASWSGSAWTRETVPAPAAQFGTLTGVSCSSPSLCIAVGWYEDAFSGPRFGALAERRKGSGWRRLPDPGLQPAGIACPSATFCIVVGQDFSFSKPAAQAWNGASWKPLPVPSPAGAQNGSLSGVSCVSAANCTAVGSNQDSAGNKRTLAEHWAGAGWKIEVTPNPGDARDAHLSAVSCPTARACVAVGYDSDRQTFDHTLAEVWDGTGWRITIAPAQPQFSMLEGVSCTSAGACVAVGTADTATVGESWNGKSWRLQTSANPRYVNPSYPTTGLNAVSCVKATLCTAVGQDALPFDGWFPVAERYSGPTAPAPPSIVAPGRSRG